MWKDKNGNTLRDYVERYIALGWNIFPVVQGTKGGFLAKWKELQKRKQTPDEIRKLFEPYYEKANINIALILGRTSGNTVAPDFDGLKLHDKLKDLMPQTMVSKTGSGKGFHYIYETDEIVRSDRETYVNENLKPRKGKIGDEDHIDIQGEGAIIILPPSVHPDTGKRYEWADPNWMRLTPTQWFGPFHETFRIKVQKRLKIKAPINEINVTRLMLGNFSKGEARPIRAFEYLTWMKSQDISEDEMWETIVEWNETNNPPIDEKKLRRQWKWVCEHEVYKLRFIEKDVKVFSPEIMVQAKAKLLDPNLEEWTQNTFDYIIYREYNNRMVAFYDLLTGKMKGGKWKQILTIKGDPGGGKSHLADALTALFITLKRARFSERAIDYMRKKIAKHEILYLKEFAGASEQNPQGGISTLKFLSADDRGYVVEIYMKDPNTGEPTTVEMRVPPITIVTTSIAIEIEKQFERRSLAINVDDSLEQTLGVLAFKSQKERDFIDEFIGLKKPNTDIKVLEAIITLIEPCEIGLLFSDTIIELFKGSPTLPLRLRGDYDKLMTIVKMRALFYQYQRPWFEKGKKKMIFVLPEDFIGVLKYAKDTILEMTTGLEKRLVDAIPVVYELKGNFIEIGSESYTGFTVEDFRQKYCPRKSYGYATKILKGLTDAGILTYSRMWKGGMKIYETVLTEAEAKKLTVSIAQTDSATLLQPLAEKEFETQFEQLCILAHEAIKVRKSVILNSQFLKRIVEKITSAKEGAVQIVDDEEKSDLVASRASMQSKTGKGSQIKAKTVDKSVAPSNSATKGD